MKRTLKCKQHQGLDRKGRLKKGYKYARGGRIVKVKKKKTGKRKKRRSSGFFNW